MSRYVLALCALALCFVPLAHAGASNVAVSQIYAGGGNAGATYANDYVELLNRGASAVSVAGWSVQYASAASTSWSVVPLTGSIRAGGYYLVKLGSGGTSGAAVPAADATGTVNLAASGGKVALVRTTDALTCGAAAGSCTGLEDLVGYGGATDFEGSAPAAAPSNTTALLRGAAGCTDADSNATDLAIGDPAPRTSASPGAACSGGGSASGGTTTAGAAVDVDVEPVLSATLERTSISFGSAFAGQTPTPVSEKVTVVSNDANGYSLTVHRSAFSPADLPLGIAPTGTGTLQPLPIPTELGIGSSTSPTPAGGDVWPTSIGFSSPLPSVPPGHYTATITFTVIGK